MQRRAPFFSKVDGARFAGKKNVALPSNSRSTQLECARFSRTLSFSLSEDDNCDAKERRARISWARKRQKKKSNAQK